MAAYTELVAATVPTRHAAALTGVSRATANRRRKPMPKVARESVTPANKLSEAETAKLLETLNDGRFVDLAHTSGDRVQDRWAGGGAHPCRTICRHRSARVRQSNSQPLW